MREKKDSRPLRGAVRIGTVRRVFRLLLQGACPDQGEQQLDSGLVS